MDNFYDRPEGFPYGAGSGMRKPANGFATAAMIVGICSLLSICMVYFSLPLGALGCVFVILSKRPGQSLDSKAIAGLVTSLIGIFFGVITWVIVILTAVNLVKPENRDSLNTLFEQYYDMDFDEYMEQFYGDNSDEWY